jgi:hypothetical protein
MAKQTAPAFPFAPDEIVEALETWAGSGNVLVRQGTRLRASNALVHRWPEKFIRDGMSDDEKVLARHRLRPEPEPTQHVPLATPAKVLLDEDAVICIRTLHGAGDGDTHLGRPLALPAGARLRRDDRMVKANRDHFVPVVPAGRTRKNSVRALTDWSEYRTGDAGNFIPETDPVQRQQFGEYRRFMLWFRGQWIPRDHPIVKVHPASVEPIL